MNIRSTFALDRATVQALARLAAFWRVSKSEALRRAVAQASEQACADDKLTPEEALEWLGCHPLPGTQISAWLAENKAARIDGDTHREQRLEQAWKALASK